MATPKLSPKQEIFCQEYLVDLNGRQAAIRAGYSPKTANEQASRLLTNVNIVAHIQKLMDQRANRTAVVSDDILRELTRIGLYDIRSIFAADGTVKPIAEWPEDVARACSTIDVVEIFETVGGQRIQTGQLKKIRFLDKLKALELLGKHLRLFIDRIDHSGRVSLADLVAGSTISPEDQM